MNAVVTTNDEPVSRAWTLEQGSPPQRRGVLTFAPNFRVDLAEERLWKGELELRLRPKPFAILRCLAQRPRRLVTHSEITEAVWGPRIAMSESLLRTHVRDLRRVLGEDLIETVVGRGYRFRANPSEIEERSREMPECLTLAPDSRARLRVVSNEQPAGDSPSAEHVRILHEVADALAALGPQTMLLVIVGEPFVRAPTAQRLLPAYNDPASA